MEGVSRSVALVARGLDSDFSRRLAAGVVEALQKEGATVVSFSLGPLSPACAAPFLGLVNGASVSGVVVVNAALSDLAQLGGPPPSGSPPLSSRGPIEQFLRGLRGLPAVCVGAWIPGVPSLWIQNAAGIRLLMAHLVDTCGRRRIAFIRGPETNLEAEARYRAWEDFCIEHSLPHDDELVGDGDFKTASGEFAVYQILDRCAGEPPDAIVVANDSMAIGALKGLRQRNIKVPDDISVVGFDDLGAVTANPPLTTIRQPLFEMGYRAAEMMLAMLRREPVPEETMFTPELVVRSSCMLGKRAILGDIPTPRSSVSVFLERAYPNASPLVSYSHLLQPGVSASELLEFSDRRLDRCVRHSQAREQDLVACIRHMRANAILEFKRALSAGSTLSELHQALLERLSCLSLSSLAAALVNARSELGTDARLVIDCSTDESSIAPIGSRLPSAQIITAQSRRTNSGLQIVQPLFSGDEYRGFLVASGRLLDNSMLRQLCSLLTAELERIGA